MELKHKRFVHEYFHVNLTYYDVPDQNLITKKSEYTTSLDFEMLQQPRQKAHWRGYEVTNRKSETMERLINRIYEAVEQIIEEENDEA